jgi:uncharacterized protein (TIGR02118 family)
MMKVTVIYGMPKDPAHFESYYKGTHLPLAAKIKGVARAEFTKFGAGPDGAPPKFYRMAELYFASAGQMAESLGSAEGKATVADIPKFASGGVDIAVGTLDE